MSAQITTLLSEKDVVEKARDAVAAILELETTNQYALACAVQSHDKEDYNIAVYLENNDPVALQNDGASFPIINVCLQGVTTESGSTATSVKTKKAQVYVDCYAVGADETPTSTAVLKAWKTARIARNILEAACYSYLGMRGVVSRTEVQTIDTGFPKSSGSVFCSIARIVFNIWFVDNSPQVAGKTIEPISLTILDENGKVIVEE